MNVQQQSARLRPFRPVPFGRYTLLTPLSMGGMGEIFLARFEGAQGFEKLCVIKKILPSLARDPEFVERFVNEAKILVKLSHGSIAQVLDVGLHEGDPYMALEYVDGKDLRKIAARARDRNIPLPLTMVLYVMGRVLDALAYAHRKRDDDEREIGLVHRDVSPQNILISYEGEVKVIDFGLAKSALSSAKTNPSMILGKFLYMSPEQARHQKVDRRADLYSAGLCLYELVCGKNPFDDVPPHELMLKVASPSIPPIHTIDPLCPAPVQEMVARALEIDPARRFQTAEEFRGKIQACLLEIDPSAGPESVTRYMRDAFAAEFQQERKLLASLKAIARPAEDSDAPRREEKKSNEHETAVFHLKNVAPSESAAKALAEPPPSRSVVIDGPIEPVPLSFNPTPRTREQLDELPPDGETVPGVLVTEELRKATIVVGGSAPVDHGFEQPWVERTDSGLDVNETVDLTPALDALANELGPEDDGTQPKIVLPDVGPEAPLGSVAVSPSMLMEAHTELVETAAGPDAGAWSHAPLRPEPPYAGSTHPAGHSAAYAPPHPTAPQFAAAAAYGATAHAQSPAHGHAPAHGYAPVQPHATSHAHGAQQPHVASHAHPQAAQQPHVPASSAPAPHAHAAHPHVQASGHAAQPHAPSPVQAPPAHAQATPHAALPHAPAHAAAPHAAHSHAQASTHPHAGPPVLHAGAHAQAGAQGHGTGASHPSVASSAAQPSAHGARPPEDTQPRVVIGTLLEEPPVLPAPQTRVRPPSRSMSVSSPGLPPAAARAAETSRARQTDEMPQLAEPTAELDAAVDPVTTDNAILDEDTGVRKIPQRPSTAASGLHIVRWVAFALVAIALAAAGFIGWEQFGKPLFVPQKERAGALPSDPKPLVPPPQPLKPPPDRAPAAPQAPEVRPAATDTAAEVQPAVAVTPAADASSADDLIEPLEVRIATAAPDPVPAPPKRAAAKKGPSKLFKEVAAEWADADRAFKALQRKHSCEVRQMRLVCGQAALLEDQMASVEDDAEELTRIRGHIRKLRQDIDKLSKKGR